MEPLLRSSGRRVAALQREAVRLRAELADRGVEVEESPDYETFVAAVQERVERSVPDGASVLVLSRGDSELLRLDGREARHFPGDEDGRYLGHHPSDDAEAISMLDAARAAGAEYLVIPTSEDWWLGHYDGFAVHLSACSRVEATDVCRIYALEPLRTGVSS